MGYFFFDESIHDRGDFILGAYVYTRKDLNSQISDTFIRFGLDPDKYEYKSSFLFNMNPDFQMLREELKTIITNDCRIGIVIIPKNLRKELGNEALKSLKIFLDSNHLNEINHNVFFDQGIFPNTCSAIKQSKMSNITNCIFHFEQNSSIIKGIQLADLVAHTCSTMLLESLGVVNKKLIINDIVEDEYLEIEIGFELWATFRFNFFRELRKGHLEDPYEDSTFKVEPYGLYISPTCDSNLTEKARKRFSEVYLGCLH